jgi:ribosomal protein L11 methyltransferase
LDLILSITNDAIEELNGSIIIRSEESLDEIHNALDYFTKELQNSLDKIITTNILSEKKQNEDWIQKYKDAIEPITVGKFHIHPSWAATKENKINILIDPALAFGSGHHETTSTCLSAISTYVKESDTLIDVGSGSGILAIAASKLGAACDICDTDPLSIQNALRNFDLNKVSVNNSWQGSAVLASKKYDVVIANIVADVLIMIKRDLKNVLSKDGILILSGILNVYEQKVLKSFKEFGIIQKIQKNDWVTLVLKKETINE